MYNFCFVFFFWIVVWQYCNVIPFLEQAHQKLYTRRTGAAMNADLAFVADYFDFQPACLSQFEYGTNVYWHWEASRFWNSELNFSKHFRTVWSRESKRMLTSRIYWVYSAASWDASLFLFIDFIVAKYIGNLLGTRQSETWHKARRHFWRLQSTGK